MTFPLYAMRMANFLEMKELLPHNELRKKGLVVPLDLDGIHKGEAVNFCSHQWLGLKVADPGQVHLRTMQDIFRRVSAGESIFKDESMWQLFVKGQSMQTASSVKAGFATHDHVEDAAWTPETSAEKFRKSIADGWVWLDFISISQTIGCQTEAEVQVALDEQGRAIASIPAYVARATHFWVIAPSGAKHHDLGHECSFATWARRGWCRLEQTALDISRLADGRPLYVTHAAGDAPAVTTEDYVDRLVFGFQRRNAVLTGEFSCCRMDHQVALPGGQQVCIPCDKDRLKLVLRSMWIDKMAALRPQWELRLAELGDDIMGRMGASMMGKGGEGGAFFAYLAFHFAEARIFAESVDEEADYWAAPANGGWAFETLTPEKITAFFDRFGQRGRPLEANWTVILGMWGHLPLLRHLVEQCGHDAGFVNPLGQTALKGAAGFGFLPMVRYLCHAKPDTEHINHLSSGLGISALGSAAKGGHVGCLREILAAGADVHVRRADNQQTPLLEAAYRGHAECVRVLIEAGADPTAADKEGKTAADYAREKQSVDEAMLRVLEVQG